MLFYLTFDMAMFFAVDTMAVFGSVMAMLVVVSFFVLADWPVITSLAKPLVVEFVFGVLIARWVVASRPDVSLWSVGCRWWRSD
jgi:peptidoglycan/LPS O-acetylase OafA/YrhL